MSKAINDEIAEEVAAHRGRDLAPKRDGGALNRQQKPLNRAACREIIFRRLRDIRGDFLAQKLTQIGGGSFDYLDRRALQFIEADMEEEGGYFDQLEDRLVKLFEDHIRRHPTRGGTLKFPPQL